MLFSINRMLTLPPTFILRSDIGNISTRGRGQTSPRSPQQWRNTERVMRAICEHHGNFGGTRQRSRLRYYATSRKATGSIPDEVIGFFNWSNPSSRTMALVSTQLLTEMSTRDLSGGKGRPARKADNLTAICEPTV
jgi:hypothetical protein